MQNLTPSPFLTVSAAFIDDWLQALFAISEPHIVESFLERSEIPYDAPLSGQRITLEQIVKLYQIAAVETGDEMMGLWSRPVRPRALQHLITTMREARSLPSALYRFMTFWNLILDDYHLEIERDDTIVRLALKQNGDPIIQRFGHMLLLKLCHGILSWRFGFELPVHAIDFAFERPDFEADYTVVFPARAVFGAEYSSISFQYASLPSPIARSNTALMDFLNNAPRDWIFTHYREHALSLQIRDFLYRSTWADCQLDKAAKALNLTPRTLIRRLEKEAISFQQIKDALRRDIAIRDLRAGEKSIEEISQDVGFNAPSNFHRAFKQWTGALPSAYRP